MTEVDRSENDIVLEESGQEGAVNDDDDIKDNYNADNIDNNFMTSTFDMDRLNST